MLAACRMASSAILSSSAASRFRKRNEEVQRDGRRMVKSGSQPAAADGGAKEWRIHANAPATRQICQSGRRWLSLSAGAGDWQQSADVGSFGSAALLLSLEGLVDARSTVALASTLPIYDPVPRETTGRGEIRSWRSASR